MRHRITITGDAGRYDVRGAVQIDDTGKPIADAAHALKLAGAADSDTLMASGPDVPTFVAQTIGKILAPRPPSPKSLSALSNGVGSTR